MMRHKILTAAKRGLVSALCLMALAVFPLVSFPAAGSAVGDVPPAPASGQLPQQGCNTAGGNYTPAGGCACLNQTVYSNPGGGTMGAGQYMIQQMFNVINNILNEIETSIYTGIIWNYHFQLAINTAFLLYVTVFGLLVMFGLAPFRTGEVFRRLIKICIVYGMTSPLGFVFFITWVGYPVIGAMTELIVAMSAPSIGLGGGGSGCASTGISLAGLTDVVPGLSGSSFGISLTTAPMAMLYGPMNCTFSAKFIGAIEALATTGFYGWIIMLLVLWGLVEFIMMILGALITYVKAIVGLVFLFGLAPIFFSFYLFEKTRSITEGWLNMVIGFTLQPVMLFAFLAFYAGIVGGALTNLFTDANGSGQDICYVPWYTVPGLFDIYWLRFTNWASAAGGQWINISASSSGALGSGIGAQAGPPIQMLNVLYFLVLTSLGRNFTSYINDLAQTMSGGSGGGVVDMQRMGNWFKGNIGGGKGPIGAAASAVSRGASALVGRRPGVGN